VLGLANENDVKSIRQFIEEALACKDFCLRVLREWTL